ncbi:MFS transporter [Phaeobacter gallaeciensis]|uniref:Transporter, MFS family n=1 Tax=Phaeobacter gallaeciensis TaxID=60890 RepID=A0AAC9Z647_9RHOB|nr:MFS transporter [Phaeobacter gallaeciensis]AHD07885.1 Arabinose efflux permease [Phaeobacter gallaeciensis DSM 26640]ATE91153.1 transporter, MFS family [Phaeobacter gallaeciensis]ATE95428.1 transporter, MFS family [Phaeobacter gallaeciensis]ATE99767.1 transporter, MFS family [Phaeobacter gallaeciensis]ATF04200.1 transporter, MFS family [Phaeobacter gallaeciensis]
MSRPTPLFTPVLIVGCVIIMVSFAVRASFGVFQIPIAEEFGWLRSEFSLAIAIQNLAWGIGQPIFGAIAEKIGDRKAIIIGALIYAAGLVFSAWATTPFEMQAYEWLVGFGIAGTGFGVVLAVVGRASSDENRSMSLAIVTAAGSAGQIFGAPTAEWLLTFLSWQSVFLVFAGVVLALIATLPLMRAPEAASKAELEESMGAILKKAFKDPSYTLIFLGFFSCGYQLAFVTAHFPAFVTEMCGPILPGGALYSIGITSTSALGAVAISLIGAANVGGTLLAGWLGNRYSKKYLLAAIYTGRTIAAAAFILVPITPVTVIVFSIVMGSLWLATVPLTSGLVAHLYGLRYMGTLYGIVFFSHQLGSFLGVWLGGRMYDIYGDYTLVWWIGVGIGAFSAIVHLPIREHPRTVLAAT